MDLGKNVRPEEGEGERPFQWRLLYDKVFAHLKLLIVLLFNTSWNIIMNQVEIVNMPVTYRCRYLIGHSRVSLFCGAAICTSNT